jgi:SAM-dependent methyltransferase
VDLGCGSGPWLRELTRAGYDALGVDRSRALLRIARRVAPRASLRVASVHKMELPRCRAVTALGEVLGYAAPEGLPPLRSLFARVAGALPRGGLLCFDLLVRGGDPPLTYRSWREGEGWAVLVDSAERRGHLTREITTFRRVGAHWRRGRERHVLRLFSPEDVVRDLRASGFSVRTSRRYGRFSLPPRRLAFVARRL